MIQRSGALESAARELGIDGGIASAGAAVLLPAILGGFKRQAQAQPSGAEGLGGLLQQMGGGGLLEAVTGSQPTPIQQGNDILGQIFGSRDVSRQVAAQASQQSGISADTLKQLLPIVAMLVAGYLANRGGGNAASAQQEGAAPAASGGLGDLLGQVLGGAMGQSAPAAPSAAGGLGGLAQILDMDRDGNPLDDILGMAGRLRQ